MKKDSSKTIIILIREVLKAIVKGMMARIGTSPKIIKMIKMIVPKKKTPQKNQIQKKQLSLRI